MDNYYLVWCESTGYTKFKHPTMEAAKQEAKRMAREHPEKTFTVLAPIVEMTVNNISEKYFDHIPF